MNTVILFTNIFFVGVVIAFFNLRGVKRDIYELEQDARMLAAEPILEDQGYGIVWQQEQYNRQQKMRQYNRQLGELHLASERGVSWLQGMAFLFFLGASVTNPFTGIIGMSLVLLVAISRTDKPNPHSYYFNNY